MCAPARFPLPALVSWLLLCVAGAATGETPAPGAPIGHGVLPPPRPLAERLDQADAVAFGVVDDVRVDRIALVDLEVLVGALEPRLELKRGPASSPEVAPGDELLLLLRGARTPYVWVDEPRELVRLAEGERPVWRAMVVELTSRPRAERPALYEEWLDLGRDPQVTQALLGLTADDAALDPGLVRRAAARALDPARTPETRAASAWIAVRSAAGRAALRDGLAEAPEPPPTGVARAVLQATLSVDRAERSAWLAPLREHPDPEVRRLAERVAALP